MNDQIDITQFPEIKELPKVERNESRGGFCYSDEFIGKAFRHNGKIIFFNERTMEEASPGMINLILSIIDDNRSDPKIEELENAFEQFETDTVDLIKKIEKEINNKIDNIPIPKDNNEDISSLKKELLELKKNFASIKSQISNQIEENNLEIFTQIEKVAGNKDFISELIDKKLTDVHKNFRTITESLVKEEVQRIEEDIKTKSNKLTVSQIAMFREMGVSMEHIIELKKSNLL